MTLSGKWGSSHEVSSCIHKASIRKPRQSILRLSRSSLIIYCGEWGNGEQICRDERGREGSEHKKDPALEKKMPSKLLLEVYIISWRQVKGKTQVAWNRWRVVKKRMTEKSSLVLLWLTVMHLMCEIPQWLEHTYAPQDQAWAPQKSN